jgi:hypothetical protein
MVSITATDCANIRIPVQDHPVYLVKVDYERAQEIENSEFRYRAQAMNQSPDHLTEKADRYRRLLADALSKTRIVARVDPLMALCDELEAKLKQSQTDGEILMDAA